MRYCICISNCIRTVRFGLLSAGGARDLRVRFEELVHGLTNETEVSIGDHFFWKFANDADEFFHLEKDCFMVQIFETKNVFDVRFRSTRKRTYWMSVIALP